MSEPDDTAPGPGRADRPDHPADPVHHDPPAHPVRPERAPREPRSRFWYTPGAGRPELHWRLIRGLTLGFAVVAVLLAVGYGVFVGVAVVAFASGYGSNK